ncbi:MAG: DUF72 domain-containing protein [Armatimonadetes bacterium]|nr:DUF72 domain-containing protein [Armatimonadota bacterium]
MPEIRLGTSGYSFEDWKGAVYPANTKSSEMFAYYVHNFRLNSVEINYTYYKMPSVKVFDSYAVKSPAGFDFTVKLFADITHKPWLSGGSGELDRGLCAQFIDGIRPLDDSNKLGCLLAQFPPHLRPGDKAWKYLHALHEAMAGQRLVYEFRNKDWVKNDTIETLKQAGIGFCAVDEPQIGPLMPLVPAVTSDIGYLRLHGHSAKWFTNKELRYDYLYSEDELKMLLPTIHSMAARSKVLYVMFNNCHAGSALQNAKMMQFLLGMDLPPVQGVLL